MPYFSGPDEELSVDAAGRVRWGRRAAGLLIVRGDGKILLAKRSEEVLDPGVWGVPGGRIEPGEDPLDAAIAETVEEMGSLPPVKAVAHDVYRSGGFEYWTFIVRMSTTNAQKWRPKLNWENDDWGWFDPDDLPEPLHPNVRETIRKI